MQAMKDVFLRFQIPFAKLRGQCYDGCNTMAGTRAGVATKVQEIEPRAVFTHCYGHALNLGVSDAIKSSPAMKDCLDTCTELVKLIKFSPKREAMLRKLKEEADSNAINVRTLCPTRWTVRAECLGSILVNYDSIQELWETALHETSDTETKARIQGIQSQMKCFKFLFCLVLTEMILQHTDKLSETLQGPKLSGVEGHEIAMLTVKTLKGLRTDGNFWQKIEKMMNELEVDEPQLARRRKTPKQFEQGEAPAEFAATPKDEYCRVYFEALDLATTSIWSRFDQKGFKIFSNVQQLLFKACGTEKSFNEELDLVCDYFYDDFSKEELSAQLLTLRELHKSVVEDEIPSVNSIQKALLSLSSTQRMLLNSAWQLFKLLLVLPATNSTSECSFSALHRIKSYLQSTMTQARLTHLMILYYHQEMTDKLDLKCIANEYILKSEKRCIFATY